MSEAGPTAPLASNLLVGQRVVLRPIAPRDYEALYQLELSTGLGVRFRHRGATPSFESYTQSLWAGVLAQFLAVRVEDATPVGLVCLYNANQGDGWAYFATAKFGPNDLSGRPMEALALFVNYVFETWNFTKLYAEVAEYNYGSFAAGARRLLVEEGRLVGHEWRYGRRWDHLILALYREKWDEWSPVIMPRVAHGTKFRQDAKDFRPTRDWPSTVASAG